MKGNRGALADPRTVAAILSPTARAQTVGSIRWKKVADTSRHEGVVEVELCGLVGIDAARLTMAATPLRPESPCLAYVVSGGAVRRLCVNNEHRPFSGTHKHQYERAGSAECYEPDDIPNVPMGARAAVRVYREVFDAFAAECNIQIGPGFTWCDPWEV